jgi:hypothetical protein
MSRIGRSYQLQAALLVQKHAVEMHNTALSRTECADQCKQYKSVTKSIFWAGLSIRSPCLWVLEAGLCIMSSQVKLCREL